MKSGATLFVIVSLAAIAAAATVVYVSTWSDAFLADDWLFLMHSKNLTVATFLHNCSFVPEDIYYRPAAIGYFYLNYALWGLEPTGHHVVKGLLFAATAALLFVFILRATGLRVAALAAALVFALHPINASCAIWLSTHANVLCAFFYLLALVLFVEVRKRERFNFPLYAGFLVLMLLCFASYELGYTLPVALILTDLLLKPHASSDALRRPDGVYRGLKPHAFLRAHAPYLVLAAAFFVLRFAYMGADTSVNEGGEVNALPAAMIVFMPVDAMDSNMPFSVRLLPALAGLVFFAAVLIFGRGLRRPAIFAAALVLVGIAPVLKSLSAVTNIENTRFLSISLIGFSILIGSCVSLVWRWKAGKVAGAAFLAALVAVYAWLDLGWKEKWSLAASQSEAVVETVTETCRGESLPFRLVFITYPTVREVFNTAPHFLPNALLTRLDTLVLDEELRTNSPYFKTPDYFRRRNPEAMKKIIRWWPIRLDNRYLYESSVFKPEDKVYEISRRDLDKTFFFYWDDGGQRLINCTDAMRERLATKRDKALLAWSAPESVPADAISFLSCDRRQGPENGTVYLSPVHGETVPPLIRIILDNTTCRDFDLLEIDLTASSKSFREGYFSAYATFLPEGDDRPLSEITGCEVWFDVAYHEFHESSHIYRIPMAHKFLDYDGKRIVMLYIVLPLEVKEYALRGIKLRRFDE